MILPEISAANMPAAYRAIPLRVIPEDAQRLSGTHAHAAFGAFT